MKKILKKILAPFSIFAMIIGVGIALQTDNNPIVSRAAAGDVTTHSFKSSIPSGWTPSVTQNGFDTTRGAQFTNASIKNGLTITYANEGTFDQVSVTAATNGTASNTKITIDIGGDVFDSVKTLTATGNTKYTFEAPALTGQLKILVSTTNTSKSTYISEVTTREVQVAAGSITFVNSEEVFKVGDEITLSPTLEGDGVLSASIEDTSVASLNIVGNSITVTGLKIGETKLNAEYAGAKATVLLSVYDAMVTIDKEVFRLKPDGVGVVTATAVNFEPTSYLWTKDDPSDVFWLDDETSAALLVEASDRVGEGYLTVEATDGVITRSATVKVIVAEIAEGEYTISVNNTEYSNPMNLDHIDIIKSNEGLEDASITNIDNTRLNSLPNDNKTISIGGNSTTGGKFTINLPNELYATSVTFNNIIVDSGKTPKLSINNGVNFIYSGSSSETLYPFANSLEISTVGTSRVWVSSIQIVAKSASNAAIDFGTYFLGATADDCAASNVTATTWNKTKAHFNSADLDVQNVIKNAIANNDGNDLEKAIARYEYIIAKYSSLDDFLEIIPSSGLRNVKNENNIAHVVIIGLLGISLMLCYHFVNKKRKQAR